MRSVRMIQMRRNLLSVLTGRHDDEMQHYRAAFERHTEAFERLIEVFDRLETRRALINQSVRSTNDLVAELDAGCVASRIRRHELLEKIDRLRPPAEAA